MTVKRSAKPRPTARRAVTQPSRAPAIPAALLANALRAQSEGVFIAERRRGARELRIVFANESFCAMTGYSAAQLVGQSHALLHAERAEVERLLR